MTEVSKEAESRPSMPRLRILATDTSVEEPGFRVAFQIPAWSPSPHSPRTLQVPPSYMRRYARERTMRESGRETSERPGSPGRTALPRRPPRPLQVATTGHGPLGSTKALRAPASAPLLPPSPFRWTTTLGEENRNILLFRRHSQDTQLRLEHRQRRQSAPPGSASARRQQIHRQQREHHLQRGFVTAASPVPRSPDLFVVPVGLAQQHGRTSSGDDDGTRRVTFRVYSSDQKPCLYSRTFDVARLRATLNGPISTSASSEVHSTRARTPRASPSVALYSPAFTPPRCLSEGSIKTPVTQSPQSDRKGSRQGLSRVPVYLEHARRNLPAIAAIIVSGIVKPGDTIDLLLPHPQAWADTLVYTYSEQVELTDEIRQNIDYLGGEV